MSSCETEKAEDFSSSASAIISICSSTVGRLAVTSSSVATLPFFFFPSGSPVCCSWLVSDWALVNQFFQYHFLRLAADAVHHAEPLHPGLSLSVPPSLPCSLA